MGVFPEEKKSLLQRFNEWREKKISKDIAVAYAVNPDALRKRLL